MNLEQHANFLISKQYSTKVKFYVFLRVKFMREWSSNRVITAGYHVCSAIGHGPTFDIDVIGKTNSIICLWFLICFNHCFLLLIFSSPFSLKLVLLVCQVMHYLGQLILSNASNMKLNRVSVWL